MEFKNIDKNNRSQKLIRQLIDVWESSVKATHLFLSEKEIDKIKKYVPQALQKVDNLVLAINDNNTPVAFMGIEKQKLEMLFVRAEERCRGIGKALIQIGFKDYFINEVCVNEQNLVAKNFYENNGFHVYKRTELDEQGNPYPLLFMKI